MKNNRLLMYVFAVLAMLCWSSTFVWFKVVLEYYRPFTIVFFRLLIAAFILQIYVSLSKKNEHIVREDWKWFVLLSFFEPFCYFLGESFGMKYVSASLGSIIISTIPLVTPFFTFWIFKEKITKYGILGLIVSFIGVILIVLGESGGNTSILGIILMFFAVFAAVGYGLIVRTLTSKYSSFTIVKIQSIMGMLLFLPLFIIFDFRSFVVGEHNLVAIVTILKLAIFGSVFAFLLMTTVIRGIGLNNANIFTNLIPVITSLLSYFILKEVFGIQKILGISVVIVGLFISQIPHLINHKKVVKFINKFY